MKWQGKQLNGGITFSKDLQAQIGANTAIKSKICFCIGPESIVLKLNAKSVAVSLVWIVEDRE